MKKCKRCGKVKKLTSFHLSELSNDGRADICAICKNNGRGTGSGRPKKQKEVKPIDSWEPKKVFIDLRAGTLHKGEYCLMWHVLSSIGYDITKSVHQQFCEKHNLPTKPKPPYKIKWCYDDCFNNEQ